MFVSRYATVLVKPTRHSSVRVRVGVGVGVGVGACASVRALTHTLYSTEGTYTCNTPSWYGMVWYGTVRYGVVWYGGAGR